MEGENCEDRIEVGVAKRKCLRAGLNGGSGVNRPLFDHSPGRFDRNDGQRAWFVRTGPSSYIENRFTARERILDGRGNMGIWLPLTRVILTDVIVEHGHSQ